MTLRRSLGWLAVGLCLAGCGAPKSEESRKETPTPVAQGDASPAPNPNPTPTPAEPGKATPPAEPKTPATPPKDRYAIAEPKTEGWTPTQRRLDDLAKRVAQTVGNMKGIYGESVTSLKTPEGSGQVQSYYKVRDNKAFVVNFPIVRGVPTRGEVRADGKQRVVKETGAYSRPAPVGTPTVQTALNSREVVQRWPKEFGRLMFLNLTDGRDAWGPVLAGLGRGEGGFQTTVEERSMQWQGRTVRNYRVRAVRSAEAAKRLGPCEMEMVFDGERFLPVTVRVDMKDPNGQPWRIEWSGAWSWTRPIDPKELALP